MTYRFNNRSQKYDESMTCRISKLTFRVEVLMKSNTYHNQRLTSSSISLSVSPVACRNIQIKKGTFIRLLHNFVVALKNWISLKPCKFARKTDHSYEWLGSYLKVVDFLPAGYMTNDVLAERYEKISLLYQRHGHGLLVLRRPYVTSFSDVETSTQIPKWKDILVDGLIASERKIMHV